MTPQNYPIEKVRPPILHLITFSLILQKLCHRTITLTIHSWFRTSPTIFPFLINFQTRFPQLLVLNLSIKSLLWARNQIYSPLQRTWTQKTSSLLMLTRHPSSKKNRISSKRNLPNSERSLRESKEKNSLGTKW